MFDLVAERFCIGFAIVVCTITAAIAVAILVMEAF